MVVFRCQDSGESQLVLQRFQQIVEPLRDCRDRLRSEWSSQLDSDCGFFLEQPLIKLKQQGMLGVNSSHKVSGCFGLIFIVTIKLKNEYRNTRITSNTENY